MAEIVRNDPHAPRYHFIAPEGRCVPFDPNGALFTLSAGERLQLRVFLDKSMLEMFANRRQCVTQRIYPSRPDSIGVSLFSVGTAARVHAVEAWDLTSTNTP